MCGVSGRGGGLDAGPKAAVDDVAGSTSRRVGSLAVARCDGVRFSAHHADAAAYSDRGSGRNVLFREPISEAKRGAPWEFAEMDVAAEGAVGGGERCAE